MIVCDYCREQIEDGTLPVTLLYGTHYHPECQEQVRTEVVMPTGKRPPKKPTQP